MTRLYGFMARLSGCLAGLCAALVLMASPAAKADDYDDCVTGCFAQYGDGPEYSSCVTQCVLANGCPNSTCRNPCSQAEYPNCSSGQCNKTTECSNAGCKCVETQLGKIKTCECSP
jgi:hypothetical protein